MWCMLCWQVKAAMSAVALLHNHVLQQEDVPGGAAPKKAKGMPKQAPAGAEGLLLWARQVSGEGAHLKKWRLILRNLPFNVSLAYLHDIITCMTDAAARQLCKGPCSLPLALTYLRPGQHKHNCVMGRADSYRDMCCCMPFTPAASGICHAPQNIIWTGPTSQRKAGR